MLTDIKQSAASAARKAGLLTGGLLCMVVGAGFLTFAAWIALVLSYGALIAAVVIGAAYFGLGLVLAGVSSLRPAPHPAPVREPVQSHTPQSTDAPPLVQAFLHGLQAGANAERRPN